MASTVEKEYITGIIDASTLPEARGAYETLHEVGSGSYSTVYAVRSKTSNLVFALKVVSKQLIVKERKVDAIMREKDILLKLRPHNRIIMLHKTFQDSNALYFLMSYCCNEDLFTWLQKFSCFDLPAAKFYTAEITAGLEYIHSLGVVHRDVKPENILLDHAMHIKLADFGCARASPKLSGNYIWEGRSSSFVGTAEYVAPEILNSRPCGPPADFWGLGCTLYRMLAGQVPFLAGNEYLTFQKIEKLDYSFPENFPAAAASLITALLQTQPADRLGLGVLCKDGLKQHAFLADVDLDTAPPPLHAFLPALTADACSYSHTSPSLPDVPCPLSVLDSPWQGYCAPDEHVAISGRAVMQRGYFGQDVHTVLFSSGRIVMISADKLDVVEESSLAVTSVAHACESHVLLLHTPNKVHYLVFEEPVAATFAAVVRDVVLKISPA